MIIAYDEQQQRIKANQAERGSGPFYCPGCRNPVILKKGQHKLPHFSHYASSRCETFSEGETEEHIAAKALLYDWFADQKCEMEAYLPDLKQRPDLLVGQTAIEVQCSPLPWERFMERTKNYTDFGYFPWWLLGRRLQPHLHRRWTLLQKAACRFAEGVGGYLWVLDAKDQRIGLLYAIHWHYKFGTSFRTHYFSKGEPIDHKASLLGISIESSQRLKWQPEAYRVWLLHKLVQQQKQILHIQALLYPLGGHIGNLPHWCYRPSITSFLLEHRLLVWRYIFHQQPSQSFSQWVSQVQRCDGHWSFPMIDQNQVLRQVYQECSDFQKIQAF
jgi:competence protein CoiA